MEEKERIKLLFQKYIEGTIRKDELEELQKSTESVDSEPLWVETLETYFKEVKVIAPSALQERARVLVEDVWRDSNTKMGMLSPHKSTKIHLIYKYVAAVVVVILLFVGVYYITFDNSKTVLQSPEEIANAKPGSNRATLSFGDGSEIILQEEKNGVVVTDKGITYIDGSDIVPSVEQVWATLSTPRGGQYQITLSDGTKVWLNSASTLKYPTQFVGKERHVEIEGEAFFEVIKNSDKPFVVGTGGQKVKVLGTTFNIDASMMDRVIRTTLITGRIEMNYGNTTRELSPGQQAQIDGSGRIKVQQVNVEDVIAWKEGYFMFNNENLQNVMTKIGNWYDLDIEFATPDLKREKVYGTISRSEDLSQVLNMLEKTGVANFKVENNVLEVRSRK